LNGPGRISIGKGCSVYLNVFDGLSIVTLTARAVVSIGAKCGLAGLTIRCADHVRMGNDCFTSASFIQDTITINSKNPGPTAQAPSMAPKPISIGRNVWLGGQCGILGGSVIGNDCVLAAGSMTRDSTIGNYRLVMGSPSSATLPIENILKMEGNA